MNLNGGVWLNDQYLGYRVIRSLPSTPVSGTVLKTYADQPFRCFAPADLEHTVPSAAPGKS
jgi:hypothetical protein